MSMPQMFEAYKQAVQRIVKDTADQIPYEVSAYMGGYLETSVKVKSSKKFFIDNPAGLRKSKKTGNLYYNKPNEGDKLRTLYGNIQRSITVGGKGNISKVSIKGSSKIEIEFGYDPEVEVKSGTKSQSLLYAVYLENPGIKTDRIARPFVEPGKEEYVKNGLPTLVAEMMDEIAYEFKRIFG